MTTGGRLYTQLTYGDADRVAVDLPLELTFRRFHGDGGGAVNYIRKPRPMFVS